VRRLPKWCWDEGDDRALPESCQGGVQAVNDVYRANAAARGRCTSCRNWILEFSTMNRRSSVGRAFESTILSAPWCAAKNNFSSQSGRSMALPLAQRSYKKSASIYWRTETPKCPLRLCV
jgi:hypothetical protein